MKDELFADLEQSVREGGAILRGEMPPSRTFKMDPVDVKNIRKRLGMSQTSFAAAIGISVGTLRNWEQGHRTPTGPARVLLQVADKHPEAILETICAAD
jgi:putative transcriptional regulator